MLKPKLSTQFKRDYAVMTRRGYDMARLDALILLLLEQEPLDARCRDHPLKGNWIGCRGCHVADDWVLVYKVDNAELRLMLSRTGTHVDVYGQ